MSEHYYAVERSTNHLAHYGVKGMKWGVRKAIYKNSDQALKREYRKAQKKLQKYKDKMDVKKQKQAFEYHMGKAGRNAKLGAGLAFGGAGGLLLAKKKFAYDPYSITNGFTLYNGQTVPYAHISHNPSSGTKALAGLGSALGLASAIPAVKSVYHVGKAITAESRMNPKGHAKAVAKYSAKMRTWQKEMNDAFSGTKYGPKKNKKRR